MNVQVQWDHGLTLSGTAESGFTVPLGGDAAVGGEEDGFRPMELLLLGLAGCTAMDVISILQKKRQNVTGFQVQVTADRAETHPKVFTAVRVHYIVAGVGVQEDAVARAIELSETKYCPAQAMLVQAVPITHTFDVVEVTAVA